VDISDCIELKGEMLSCHESQRNWLRAQHGMDECIESMSRWSTALGERASQVARKPIRFAEAFRQHRGHAYPQDNIVDATLRGRVIDEPEFGKA
jgi:hypothetical protein